MARIAINVRKIEDFGIGRYIEQLVYQLSLHSDPRHTFLLLGGDRALLRCRVAEEARPRFLPVRESSRSYSLREQLSLPLALRRQRVDLYHSTHYVLPLGPLPRLVVTSVHDVIHLLFPQHLPSRGALLYARHFLRRALRRSAAVITGSRASRDDLLSRYPCPAAAGVRVIPYGVDERFHPAGDRQEVEADGRTLARLGLDRPYILYVGNFKPHKNLAGALAAFGRLQAAAAAGELGTGMAAPAGSGMLPGAAGLPGGAGSPGASGGGEGAAAAALPGELQLVLVGRELHFQSGLAAAVADLPRPDLVRPLGRLPDEDLPALYRRAELFLFPSLYEGFGLPPLEALACGTPVVASDRGALPEVLGEAACLVDPEDPPAVARAMTRLLAGGGQRAELRRRGTERARLFTWPETARRTLALYDELLAG